MTKEFCVSKFNLKLASWITSIIFGCVLGWGVAKFSTHQSCSSAYPQAVLNKYFDIKIARILTQNHLIEVLKTNHFIECNKEFPKEENSLEKGYFGYIQMERDKPRWLWICRNLNRHHGIFILLNENCEVIYLESQMGMISEVILKDLFQDGQNILLITHAAGGSGSYSTIMDLITHDKGVLTLQGSLLKEARWNRIGPPEAGLIKFHCTADYTNEPDENNKKTLVINETCRATLYDPKPKPDVVRLVNEDLEKEFGMTLNVLKTFRRVAVISDITIPIVSFFPASVPISGYNARANQFCG